jgi:hydroxypyruvate reductase
MQNKIQEYEQLAGKLVQAAIDAADPGQLLSKHISVDADELELGGRRYDPAAVLLVSVGKAAVAMARTAVQQLGPYLTRGIVISKAAEVTGLPTTLRHFQGSHPVPDERSLRATAAVREQLSGTAEDELVLCLISGGTSALLTEPALPLPHWQQLNQALLASGCTINEINTVRQLFDRVKGGGLAQWAAPAECVSLILSDVIGNCLEHIGSGPTVAVAKEPEAVRVILDEYQVWERLDEEAAALVKAHLNSSHSGQEVKAATGHHLIIGDVSTATAAVARQTAEWGFETQVVSNTLTGEAREIGRMAVAQAKDLRPNQCLVWGGESTVTIRGNGRGGRNQELALAAAIALQDIPGCLVAAFSTDGEDGPTPVAGAVVSSETVADAKARGLDAAEFLANNDSYPFFEQLGWGHLTAERGTNVNDILVVLRRLS